MATVEPKALGSKIKTLGEKHGRRCSLPAHIKTRHAKTAPPRPSLPGAHNYERHSWGQAHHRAQMTAIQPSFGQQTMSAALFKLPSENGAIKSEAGGATIPVDPNGDLTLVVGSDTKKSTFLVCSRSLSRLSPVFRAMVSNLVLRTCGKDSSGACHRNLQTAENHSFGPSGGNT